MLLKLQQFSFDPELWKETDQQNLNPVQKSIDTKESPPLL